MPRLLGSISGPTRILSPTTSLTIARRIIASQRVYADLLPPGFSMTVPVDLLLHLYVAEEEARLLSVDEIAALGLGAGPVVSRSLAALVQQGLAIREADIVQLTPAGEEMILGLVDRIYRAQRALD